MDGAVCPEGHDARLLEFDARVAHRELHSSDAFATANTGQVFSWIGLCAAVPFISALCIQGLIILNSPTYVPQRWHSTLLMWAFLTIPVLCNIFGRKLLK